MSTNISFDISQHHLAFSHGDLCLSNILYNSHNNRLYIIDPKGQATLKSHPTISDIRYDISKLFHSFIGGYDHILANHFSIVNGSIKFSDLTYINMQEIYSRFRELIIPDNLDISLHELLAINVMLFVSMTPLHDENKIKQKAFLINAKRLFMMLNI